MITAGELRKLIRAMRDDDNIELKVVYNDVCTNHVYLRIDSLAGEDHGRSYASLVLGVSLVDDEDIAEEDRQWKLSLKPGDVVTWNDPDNDECSRTGTIAAIEFTPDDAAHIVWGDGSQVTAFLEELERPDEPPSCECDNGHQQNDTVCRWCWNRGRRHWNDPEVTGEIID